MEDIIFMNAQVICFDFGGLVRKFKYSIVTLIFRCVQITQIFTLNAWGINM